MVRLVVVGLVVAAVALPSAPAGAQSDCYPTGAATTAAMNVAPTKQGTNADVALYVLLDLETYRAGSLVIEVSGPSGTVEIRERTDGVVPGFRTSTPGHYTASARWQVVQCRDAAGTPQYADASAPAAPFEIVGRDLSPRVVWHGRPGPGGTAKPYGTLAARAGISGDLVCPDPDRASDAPITMTVRYGTRNAPDESARPITHTFRCPLRHRSPLSVHQSWGQYGFIWFGVGVAVAQPHQLHVWIEVTQAGHTLSAIRVRMRPKGRGMSMVADGGACTRGCVRRWKAD